MTLYIFGNLIYLSIFFANKKIIKFSEYDYMILKVNFSVEYEKSIFYDYKITLSINDDDNSSSDDSNTDYKYKNNDKEKGYYIIYNNYTFENKKPKEIVKEINEQNPYEIFIFEERNLTENFIDEMKNTSNSCDKFNLILFVLIIFFFVFMKITLFQNIFKLIRKIKTQKINGTTTIAENLISQIHENEENENFNNNHNKHIMINPVLSFLNPLNFFYYVIFHLTIVVIIPIIYPDFVEYKINDYYGFVPNLFSSVYYYRSNYGRNNFKSSYKNLKHFIITENDKNNKDIFLSHKNLDFSSYSPSNKNPYMINLIVMIGSIWISQFFKPFDTDKNVQINEINLKANKFVYYFKKFVLPILLYSLWLLGFGYGMYDLIDYIYLFHRYFFFNQKKLFDYQVSGFLLLFYYHIYFYALSGYYVFETLYKNKKAREEIKMEIELKSKK
jgi:hypothetical protein